MTERDHTARGRAAVQVRGLFGAHGRAVLDGTLPPVPTRDAATVMLLRPAPAGPAEAESGHGPSSASPVPPGSGHGPSGASSGPPSGAHPSGLQVFMLRRPLSMAFAPGAYVFPGGSVDQADHDGQTPWAGPGADAWARALGTSPEVARAVVCAAVRETFEECGALLASPDAQTPPVDTAAPGWAADREAMLAGTLPLARLLRERDLVLRSDLLWPWARWVTPVTEERRYDTWFFAAALPEGQAAQVMGTEADSGAWVEPAATLAAAGRGEVALFPPTAVCLADLQACPDVATALDTPRTVTPLQPDVVLVGDEAWLSFPEGVTYPL